MHIPDRPAALFAQVLGSAFDDLPEPIRATHSTEKLSRWEGRASVRRGVDLWSSVLAWIFGFPSATSDVAVSVTKTVVNGGETWVRCFGAQHFRSHLRATPEGMWERFGLFAFLLDLKHLDGELLYPLKAGRLGPIPLPLWALPQSIAREFVQDASFHFDVKLLAPLTGKLLVHYQGYLSAADPVCEGQK